MSMTKVSVFAAVFIGLAVGSARADDTILMKVKVPFQFVVHGQVLPAGDYDVRTGDDGMMVIWLKGEKNNKSAAVTFTIPGRVDASEPSGKRPALVFTPYENQYRLSQIKESGNEYLVLGS